MMNKKLQWREVSQKISPSGLLVYLLLQEEGKAALSPTFVEKTGLMTKGTASKAITELKRNELLTEKGELVYLEE